MNCNLQFRNMINIFTIYFNYLFSRCHSGHIMCIKHLPKLFWMFYIHILLGIYNTYTFLIMLSNIFFCIHFLHLRHLHASLQLIFPKLFSFATLIQAKAIVNDQNIFMQVLTTTINNFQNSNCIHWRKDDAYFFYLQLL